MKIGKTLYLTGVLLVSLAVTTLAWAAYDATLVVDARNVPELPRHFRTLQDSLPAHLNAKGLADLPVAGGAQFSRLGLEKILERLHIKRMTIIDLRQESHGFLNGNAISWYASGDAINAGFSMQQIEKRQARLLNELAGKESIKTYVILSKTPNERIDKTKMIEFSMRSVSSEPELAYRLNHVYQRLYVQDHHAPAAKQVDRFIEIVKQLPKKQWVYFHCRAGIGRTTTFLAMYDMMQNAKQVSFDDIIARQAALGGKDLSELPQPGTFKYKAATERLAFLKQFYQYAYENEDHFRTSWTEWSK